MLVGLWHLIKLQYPLMEYKESYAAYSSYTPRRKDKFEAYGGLQLKTRTVDQEAPSNAPERQHRRQQSLIQDADSSLKQSRGLSKRRQSAVPAYANSKYLYETRYDEDKREDNVFRELRPRDNQRELRELPRDKRPDFEDKPTAQQSDYRKGSYMANKRNEAILRQSRKDWSMRSDNKQNQPKAMDPQLIQKLCSISKLSSRISERLKSMTMAMEKQDRHQDKQQDRRYV